MGNTNYFDELIASYLSNELNPEEEAFVLEWINSSEANKHHFEELKSTWNLLAAEQTAKDIDVEMEWSRFRQSISTKRLELSLSKFDSPAEQHSEDVIPVRKPALRRLFMTSAIAASTILIIALGWKLFYSDGLTIKSSPAVTYNAPSKTSINSRVNATDKIETITLADGTVVKLYGKSEISYNDHFNGDRRDIRLSGKADFKVAKDKARPFTVYSGDIATTALGTQFTVTAYANEASVAVKLYEGKVVVKSSDVARVKLNNDFFLVPGQELIYENRNLTARVRSYGTQNNMAVKDINKKESVVSENPTIPANSKESWYMFNNEPLSQVLQQLEGMYDVDIIYPKKDLSKIYFIGTFNVSDSLDDILKQIAVLNNLTVARKNHKIIISKK